MGQLPAYQQLADGYVLPASLGGHAALDFCNTLAGWGDDQGREYLIDYDAFAIWAAQAGLVTAGDGRRVRRLAQLEPNVASTVLAGAKEIREVLYAICTRSDRPRDWALLAGHVEAGAAAARFRRRYGGTTAQWEVPVDVGVVLPLHAVALSAGELLATHPLDQVHRCPGRGCGWLFLDRSGRRRWCSMAACGNREKVRRHAARHRRPQ